MDELAVTPAHEGPSRGRLAPHIGAFVLETLTLGMYGEPRHTLREYVQNSFDAIRSAQRTGFLTTRGYVTITLEPDSIVIKDNGLGIPADQAWRTLTSIGASKKDRQRDAGFRGIGRLAGMAYCEHMTFRTTFPGETALTETRFDCQKLLEAMSPDGGGDVELTTLLESAIDFSYKEGAENANDHFFEVTLRGLGNAPTTLTDADKVCSYLSQTVPVDFDPEWHWSEQIRDNYKAYFGSPMETIDLLVFTNGSSRKVRKLYGRLYEHSKGTMELRNVDFFSGEDNRYWGWVGRLETSAAVTDRKTRGIRLRVRNIQVNGTQIVEKLFTDIKPSYGRFNSYYIGEIHIDPSSVIPNARRDGFEELEGWSKIKHNLMENICRPLSADAYEASRQGGSNVAKLVDDISKLADRSSRIAENAQSSYDQIVDLMNSAKRLRRRASGLLKVVDELDEATVDMGQQEDRKAVALREAAKDVEAIEDQGKMLMGQVLSEEERLTGLKGRLRQEILHELLDIVNAFVDSTTYHRIKEKLNRS